MKLLIVIPAVGPFYGGPSKSVVELAMARAAHPRVDVDIITTNANGRTNLDVPLGEWVNHPSYRIQYFPRLKRYEYKFSLSMTLWLFKHVGDYDIVHTNSIFNYPILAACLACRIRKIPYLMTPHGMLEPWALAYKAWKKKLHFNLVERWALRRASAIHVLTSTEVQNVESLGISSRLIKVSNGININDFEELPDGEEFYRKYPSLRGQRLVIFLGRIDPKKGLDLLAEAFAKVRRDFPDVHLVVAGPDNIGFQPQVVKYFSNVSCLDAVTFTGMLTGSMVYSALSTAYLYVSPSYSEGFSMSIIEGMASGLPCIFTKECHFPEASSVGAAKEINPCASELFEAMSELLQDPQKAKAMGQRARKLILDEYTWDMSAMKIVQAYEDIVKSKNITSEAGSAVC